MHLPFPPEHLDQGAPGKGPRSRSNAQGHPGLGEQGGHQGKDREGDSQAVGHALAVGGSHLEGRHRRVADLHDFSKKPLDPDPNQQCFGKDEPGDQEKDPGGWQLPGRSIGPDAGVGPTQACRGYPVGARRYLDMDRLQNKNPRKEALGVVGAG